MKLAVNAMIAVTNESLAETLVLAEQFGIERERAYDVLAGGALASPFVLYKRGAFLHPDTRAGRVHDRADARRTSRSPQDLAARLGVRIPAAAAAAGVLDDGTRQRSGRRRHRVGDRPARPARPRHDDSTEEP